MHVKLITIQRPPYTFIKYVTICTDLKTGMIKRQKRSGLALLERKGRKKGSRNGSSEDANPGNPSLAKTMSVEIQHIEKESSLKNYRKGTGDSIILDKINIV